MRLLIACRPDEIILELQVGHEKEARRTIRVTDHRSLNLLQEVLAFCREQKIALSKLSSVGIVQGEGSFTTQRQAASIANALHWLCGTKTFTIDTHGKGKLKEQGSYLTPLYSGEPNITLKKQTYPHLL